MKGEERRKSIITVLEEEDGPISGSQLAKKYKVSRQVIVQDVAILRAKNEKIIATPQGYLLPEKEERGILRTVVMKHQENDDLEKELNLMVDHGAEVVDVIVEHPIYGEIKGNLNIRSRYDVQEFIKKIKREEAKPLSELTDGVHIHTLKLSDEKTYKNLIKALQEKNFLIQG